ncbi:MAG: DUF1015 domain-containing protein [Terriglobia bacterium]
MAEIRPFRALHYNREKIPDLSRVITQPYDKISPDMQAGYYAASPHNLVRIIKGRETPEDSAADNVYTRAQRDLDDWIRRGVLISDETPAMYPYFQEYDVPGQSHAVRERRGFIALLKLEDYSARVVHRHEETLAGPKADRMELLKRTRAHYGQVFFLYSDPAGEVESALSVQTTSAPWEEMKDEYGTRHSVWRIADGAAARAVIDGMKDKKLVIADGHHRYETALAYRDRRRAEPAYDGRADYVMATFIRMETEGLTVLPTHRVIHDLRGFDWEKFRAEVKHAFDRHDTNANSALGDGKPLREALASHGTSGGRRRIALAAYGGSGRLALLTLRPEFDLARALPGLSEQQRRLDVVVLHRLVLERALGISEEDVRHEKNVRYSRELADAVREVDSGKAQICFLMNPTPVEAVRDVAFAADVMPQKSTDFYPKLLSGLTIYWLDNPRGM